MNESEIRKKFGMTAYRNPSDTRIKQRELRRLNKRAESGKITKAEFMKAKKLQRTILRRIYYKK